MFDFRQCLKIKFAFETLRSESMQAQVACHVKDADYWPAPASRRFDTAVPIGGNGNPYARAAAAAGADGVRLAAGGAGFVARIGLLTGRLDESKAINRKSSV